MASLDGKYHVKIESDGYILAKIRGGRHAYTKKRAQSFVNKFASGDSSYRDASFWQFFAQTNWRNGSQQLKFDDAGKFWKSENVNTNQLEQLTLSRKLTSIGQAAANIKINTLSTWRASQAWWDSNYDYRKQITVTASANAQVPEGYPLKITEDTAALQTASKLLANRNDWQVIYWNGSNWVQLKRDYISAAITFFAAQVAIPAGQTDTNYYIYYGYSGETGNQQPTTSDEWNQVYAMFGTTPDANSKAIYHMKEGTGASLADNKGSNTGTITGATWATAGLLGRYLDFSGTAQYVNCGAGADFNLGSFTIEGWFWLDDGNNRDLFGKWGATDATNAYKLNLEPYGVLRGFLGTGSTTESVSQVGSQANGKWYHLAFAYDGVGDERLFVDGVLQSETGGLSSTPQSLPSQAFFIGTGAAATGQKFDGRAQHIRVSNILRTSFPYAISEANQPTLSTGTETAEQPPTSSFDLYCAADNGKVYQWDGNVTWTEVFDCRRLEWYETGGDGDLIVGDVGGVETAQAQGFKLDEDYTLKAIEVYLKKNAGTPGDITVRIETDTVGKPSGTLAHANATTTIAAFTTATYAWVEAIFASTFALTAATQYHIVLKTAAAANDQNYAWQEDGTSPTYADGSNNYSADGGAAWTIDDTSDMYFRIKGDATHVNCSLVTYVGGNKKLLFGVGDSESQVNGEARIYSYNGTLWALEKGWDTATHAQVLSLAEFKDAGTLKVLAGTGPQAKIYETSDLITWTESTDINVPQNPGYIWDIKEYNGFLYAGGGSPELLPTDYYNGFIQVYDTTAWSSLYPFDFSVIKCFEFYDAYLFIGTYHGHLFVYDTASLNPLFNFKDLFDYRVSILDMKYYDDKLYMALYPQEGSNETNIGIWTYDRHGMSLAFNVSGVTGYKCMEGINNLLIIGTGDNGYIYKVDLDLYAAQGFYQSSYYDANLPSIPKLFSNVVVKHKPLATGTNIKVYYKFKESDSWTLLGTSETVGTEEATFDFPAGIVSKKISLKVELNTSDSTKTPTLEEVVMKYTLYPDRKWMWNMRLLAKKKLQLIDKTDETTTADVLRTQLENYYNDQQLVTFTDIDGTAYECLIHEINQGQWLVNEDDVTEDAIEITLIEA